ncbi:MAG: glycine oxidase ThiO [Planctomycetaceae bacterium]|nr:glycine oxidase ThiO [Planctomycetaceae bacterium]
MDWQRLPKQNFVGQFFRRIREVRPGSMPDVVMIGGGVIGLSLAYELAGQGVQCAVLDQSAIGQESSWAGAGILPPGDSAHAATPEARLRAASHSLWPQWSERLLSETGIDNGYRRCGGLEVRLQGPPDELDAEIARWRDEGVEAVPLSWREAWFCEPGLAPGLTAAYRLPQMGQVRNPRHLKALIAACTQRGVTLLPGNPAWGFERSGERILAVQTTTGKIAAGQFVVTSGAWSGRLLAQAGCPVAIRPLRGQIVLFAAEPCPLKQVINVGPRYLVPRGDGRVLVGATEEDAGFDKRTTAGGIGGLIAFGLELCPALAAATVERTWAGLRPQSADGLPYLGLVPQTENLFVATGHFRAGLQLSPITAVTLAQRLTGRPTTVPLEPYAVDRHPQPLEFPEITIQGSN